MRTLYRNPNRRRGPERKWPAHEPVQPFTVEYISVGETYRTVVDAKDVDHAMVVFKRLYPYLTPTSAY